MVVERHGRTFGIFFNQQTVVQALNQLSNSGFLMEQISVVVKQADINELSESSQFFPYPPPTAAATSIVGSLLGAICGCLVGTGVLIVPGVGSLIAIGTATTALVGTLTGAGIGVVSGGLISVLEGIEMDSGRVERDRHSQAEYLVMVNGTDDEIRRADSILGKLR